MIVYLVRHAESLPRGKMNYEEGYDIGLSSFGRWQAKKAGKKIKKWGVRKIIASPMARAKETAEIIQGEIGGKLLFDKGLEECAPSRTLAGKAFKEAKRKMREDHSFIAENSESFDQSVDRFVEVLKKHTGENAVCVVSHALVIQNVLMKLCSLDIVPEIDEVSVSGFTYEHGAFKLLFINRSASLWAQFLGKVRKKFKRAEKVWD